MYSTGEENLEILAQYQHSASVMIRANKDFDSQLATE